MGNLAADPERQNGGRKLQGRVQRLWLDSPCRMARVRDSLLPCESMGIKDYDSPGTAKVKMTQGNSAWYSPGSVSYIASSADIYNGTLYRRDWNADDGYYYTAVSGPFYRNYSKSRLFFANDDGHSVNLYDDTTISTSVSGSGGTTKTFLVRGASTAMQNFAFDMDLEE